MKNIRWILQFFTDLLSSWNDPELIPLYPGLHWIFARVIMCNMLNQTVWETTVPVCAEMSNRTSAAGNYTSSFTIIVEWKEKSLYMPAADTLYASEFYPWQLNVSSRHTIGFGQLATHSRLCLHVFLREFMNHESAMMLMLNVIFIYSRPFRLTNLSSYETGAHCSATNVRSKKKLILPSLRAWPGYCIGKETRRDIRRISNIIVAVRRTHYLPATTMVVRLTYAAVHSVEHFRAIYLFHSIVIEVAIVVVILSKCYVCVSNT